MSNDHIENEDDQGVWKKASRSTESALKVLMALTLWLGVLPFVIYLIERMTGSLPSYEVWERNRGNHGPWWGTLWELTVCYSLMWLIVLTPILTMVLSLKDRQYSVFGRGLLLTGLQIVFWIAQFWFLFWTVD